MDPVKLGRVELIYEDPEVAIENEKRRKLESRSMKSKNATHKAKRKKSEPHSIKSEGATIAKNVGAVNSDNSEEESDKPKDEYVVETILDRCDFGGDDVFYLVKWKFWQSKYNTWEPAKNLAGNKYIQMYVESVENPKEPSKSMRQFMLDMGNPSKENLERFMRELRSETKSAVYEVKAEVDIRRLALNIMKTHPLKRGFTEQRLTRWLMLKYLYVVRTRQMTALREWQEEMSRSTNDGIPLKVENDVDLEGPPDHFFYVNEYIPGPSVVIPDDPPVGCSCKTCSPKSVCCSKLANFRFGYTPQGTLQVPYDLPIYECNKRCRCGADCGNRVVQRGRRVKLCIFRTPNGCGWGVKTLERIAKGTFVCRYVGEVIRNNEAADRMDKYQECNNTYLFDMDYNGAHYHYTVDGTVYGNASRFINHSCEPNLTVCFVWVDCLDPSLPLLAFFTARDIEEGEEITIDYIGDSVKVTDANERRTKPCKCGAPGCKKFIL